MGMLPNTFNSAAVRSEQRGVSLLFAMLSLVAMSLAMMALVRATDTGSRLMGNIGFKQDATAAADRATRVAVDWLTLNKTGLSLDMAGQGYYASTQELAQDGITLQGPIDATGQQLVGISNRQLIDWDGDHCASAVVGTFSTCTLLSNSAGTINGNLARYVVIRLCAKSGDPALDASISCVQRPPVKCVQTKDMNGYPPDKLPCPAPSAYYRVVVRVLGARNTVSFTETIVHF
jgi:type IV pilus assembly protein PilX